MTEVQQLTEATLAHDILKRLGDEKSVLRRVSGVLELIGRSTVGLGEVLQDYAHQACSQLADIIRAAENASRGTLRQDDAIALMNIHFMLKTVKSVLEMTPQAMQRNKAEFLGEKDKLTRADISSVTHAFLHSPDIARLLAAEDSGRIFAPFIETVQVDASGRAVQNERMLASASH